MCFVWIREKYYRTIEDHVVVEVPVRLGGSGYVFLSTAAVVTRAVPTGTMVVASKQSTTI